MKWVDFKGKRLAVENWANFITMDDDGAIWAWEAHPFKLQTDEHYHCLIGQREYITTVEVDNENMMVI